MTSPHLATVATEKAPPEEPSEQDHAIAIATAHETETSIAPAISQDEPALAAPSNFATSSNPDPLPATAHLNLDEITLADGSTPNANVDMDMNMIANLPGLDPTAADSLAVLPHPLSVLPFPIANDMDFSYPSIEVDDVQFSQPLPEPAIPQTPPESGVSTYDTGGLRRIDAVDQLYLAMQQGIPFNLDQYQTAFIPSNVVGAYEQSPPPADPVQAYAKLEFEDGTYYMKTLNLILGRDTEGYHAALRYERALVKQAQEELNGTTNETPKPPKLRHLSGYSQSVMSQTGGFVRNFTKDAKGKKSRKSRRSPSSDGGVSRRNSTTGLVAGDHPHRSYVPDSQAPRPVVEQTETDPNDETFLAVHPSSEGIMSAAAYKKISRRHAKISYNHQTERFELEALSESGTFLNSEHCKKGSVRPLQDQDEIQIFDLTIIFALPTTNADEEGYATTDNGKQISFGFDTASRDAKLFEDSDDSEPDRKASVSEADDQEDGSASDAESVPAVPPPATPLMIDAEAEPAKVSKAKSSKLKAGDTKSETKSKAAKVKEVKVKDVVKPALVVVEAPKPDDPDKEVNQEPTLAITDPLQPTIKQGSTEEDSTEPPQHHVLPDGTIVPVPERRGPGRPPKNGVMSKRRERELQREIQEAAAGGLAPDGSIISLPNKVGILGHIARLNVDNFPKRKYTKRKPKDPDNPGAEGSPEDPSKEKKEKKEKAARSPSPVFDEAELTPEQLSKPTANYVTLIHEALSNPDRPMMSLPQIYRAITRKYPYFAVKVSTTGWQSSVRHNLSQHPAFEKIERDGKGWMWAIVPGSSIEKEKKRRPTPPPQMPMPPYSHMYSAPPGYMQRPPQGYGYPPPSNGSVPGSAAYGPPHGYPPIASQGYMPPPALPPPPPPPSGYSSPYASKPPPPQSNQPVQPSPLATGSILPGATQPAQAHGPLQSQESTPPTQPAKPARPVVSDKVNQAVESFRGRLVKQIEDKVDNPEAIVSSAIDRVLGRKPKSTSGPENPEEEKILSALRNVINAIEPPPKPAQPVLYAGYPPPNGNQPLQAGQQPYHYPPHAYQQQFGPVTVPRAPSTGANGIQLPRSGSVSSGAPQPSTATVGTGVVNNGLSGSEAVGQNLAPENSSVLPQAADVPVQSIEDSKSWGNIKVERAASTTAISIASHSATPVAANGTTEGKECSILSTPVEKPMQTATPTPVNSNFHQTNFGAFKTSTTPVGTTPSTSTVSSVSALSNLPPGSSYGALRSLMASNASHVWPPQPTAATFAVTNPPGSSTGRNSQSHAAKASPAPVSSTVANSQANQSVTTSNVSNQTPANGANANGKRPFEASTIAKDAQPEEPEFKKLSMGVTS